MQGESVARRIEQLMKSRGWTQKDLAAALGVSQPAVSQYLKGRIPPAPVLYQLARLGRTSMEWILTGTSRDRPPAQQVQEPGSTYGNRETILRLYQQLPPPLQQALLTFLHRLVDQLKTTG